jgi:hypothetical protein
MYIANGSVEDGYHHGSTKLHIDMTDAVNIMVWTSDRRESESRYALWRIFSRTSSTHICDFLRDHGGFIGPGHPIHSQHAYFTESMLKELNLQFGVQPFTIKQYAGDAVFIPAGCAHQVHGLYKSINILLISVKCQVSNQTDAMKIACDFISIDNVTETQRVHEELRRHRLATGAGEDVLQLYASVWHAWKSLTNDRIFTDTTNDLPNILGPQLLGSNQAPRRKEKNRAIKNARMFAERPFRPGYSFDCPFCPRMFHRAGIIDHL